MADVEVRQTAPQNSGGGMGWILALVGIVVVLLLAWVLFSRGTVETDSGPDINIEVPQADAPSINVPDRVDVNVNTDPP